MKILTQNRVNDIHRARFLRVRAKSKLSTSHGVSLMLCIGVPLTVLKLHIALLQTGNENLGPHL